MSYTPPRTLARLDDVDIDPVADEQQLAWDETLGLWVPATPAGSAEIDYSENVTGTVTTVAGTTGANGTAVDIPSCSISVAAQASPVWIEAKVGCSQSVAGQGRGMLMIVETTGTPAVIDADLRFLPNSNSARGADFGLAIEARIGTVASTRTFKLQARCDSVSGNTPSFLVVNSAIGFGRSYIHAYRR